jgi:hypothetical protein
LLVARLATAGAHLGEHLVELGGVLHQVLGPGVDETEPTR